MGNGKGLGNRQRYRVLVVLADEDDRQPPNGSQVQRLVNSTLVRRAVTKERGYHPIRAREGEGEGGADGDRDSCPDNARGAEKALVESEQMHRATKAAADTRLPTEHLCHHSPERDALGYCMGMTAMRARHLIARAKSHCYAGGH